MFVASPSSSEDEVELEMRLEFQQANFEVRVLFVANSSASTPDFLARLS